MIKVINYFVRMTLIVFVILISKSSTTVYSTNVENDNTNKTINLLTMALKVDEVEAEIKAQEALKTINTYTGDLTGYAYDCPLCNGTLGCLPKYYIKDGKTTYNDYQYGTVRIVASSKKIPCGSIIAFDSTKVSDEKVYAIVLDRGVLNYDIDLLTPSEAYATKYIGRSTITYDVLRSGW